MSNNENTRRLLESLVEELEADTRESEGQQAREGLNRINALRESWQTWVYENAVESKNFENAVAAAQKAFTLPTAWRERKQPDRSQMVYAEVNIFAGQSAETMLQVLRGLGVLDQAHNLGHLKNYPAWRPGTADPAYHFNSTPESAGSTDFTDRLPTIYQGVELRVSFQNPSITMSVALPALKETLQFPQ